MLDPVKNAKTIGFLLIIVGLITGFTRLFDLMKFQDLVATFVFAISVGWIITGFGLRKTKLWAVYGIGVFALIQLALIIFSSTAGESMSMDSIISLIVMAVLFFWFYSARNKFA